MPSPSWLLLLWSGFAATLAAALFGSAFGAGTPRAWSLLPRTPSFASAFRASFITGVVVYPLLYGIIFELLGKADVIVGLAAGGLHAIIAFALAQPHRDRATAARSAGAHLVYVTVLAFVYITA